MNALALILLTSSPSATPEAECWLDGGPHKAPANVSWPKGLPEAVRQDGGTFLPTPLDGTIARQLGCLDRWPRACQVAVDAEISECSERLAVRDRQIVDLQKELAAIQPKPPTAWPTWAVAAIAGGAAVVGGLAVVGGYRVFGR